MRKLADVWEPAREAVVPVVCWRVSTGFSAVGSGRKRGPTLLDTHNENSAAATTAARKMDCLDNPNCVIELVEILAETISKGPNRLTSPTRCEMDLSWFSFTTFPARQRL
jgi:hypothetical protein